VAAGLSPCGLPRATRGAQSRIQCVVGDDRIGFAQRMHSVAGPPVRVGCVGQSCANWIEFDISQAREPVALRVNQHRSVSSFEQTASPAMSPVEVVDVSTSHRLHDTGDCGFRHRRQQQMGVVRHEDIPIHGDVEACARVAQRREIQLVVRVRAEYREPIVSSLDDVVRESWHRDSRASRHALSLRNRCASSTLRPRARHRMKCARSDRRVGNRSQVLRPLNGIIAGRTWRPGYSDPGSDPCSDPGSDPGSDPNRPNRRTL
jgi:hypothetical protein